MHYSAHGKLKDILKLGFLTNKIKHREDPKVNGGKHLYLGLKMAFGECWDQGCEAGEDSEP